MEKELQGRNVILTGGRKGIGRQIAGRLAEQGANLWVCSHEKDIHFEEDMHELSQRCGVNIETIYFNLLDVNDIKKGIKRILSSKLPVDILINNA